MAKAFMQISFNKKMKSINNWNKIRKTSWLKTIFTKKKKRWKVTILSWVRCSALKDYINRPELIQCSKSEPLGITAVAAFILLESMIWEARCKPSCYLSPVLYNWREYSLTNASSLPIPPSWPNYLWWPCYPEIRCFSSFSYNQVVLAF